MKYLFFDTEKATSNGGNKICEFGYVITNENFEILERFNFVINPNIHRSEWDWYVVKKILTRKISEYQKKPLFTAYYDDIVSIFSEVDYVFGHSLNNDAKALNDECVRYGLPSIDFNFYDIKYMYKSYAGTNQEVSLEKIMEKLQIEGEVGNHDAEVDSINTMKVLSAMIKNLECSLDEMIDLCPLAYDRNNNYKIDSFEKNKINKMKDIELLLKGDDSIVLKKYNDAYILFLQFLDNIEPSLKEAETLKNLKFSISINYEENHFRQMLNIAQILCNKGATYVKKASECDIFVTYDCFNEDGTVKACSKLKYVDGAIAKGNDIKKISFEEFMTMLDLTEEQLDELPMVSLNCLYKESAVIKNRKMKIKLNAINSNKPKMFGSLIGDLYPNLSECLN